MSWSRDAVLQIDGLKGFRVINVKDLLGLSEVAFLWIVCEGRGQLENCMNTLQEYVYIRNFCRQPLFNTYWTPNSVFAFYCL